ncbi:hypothetical protein [Candidatus Nitrosarchaeum limnium]|uniref:Uncharacterized protein n=1 Tax=Candidatus Nitrosarchaeum limnium BG20 TaxID=859192 RepID=S2ENZ0_9ARCH|nr:hypothetical protein [Candidatus Nitrosarchaeum limnium]EPA06177.1 hypothetical protein BG20_I0824 [Candidatus Nitrosarchaeum limnium BG20]
MDFKEQDVLKKLKKEMDGVFKEPTFQYLLLTYGDWKIRNKLKGYHRNKIIKNNNPEVVTTLTKSAFKAWCIHLDNKKKI